MLEVAKVISPLHSLSRQNGSSQPLSSPLTDEMWFVSVINIIMFILSCRSAVCQTIGDHITASSWKICPPNKRQFHISVRTATSAHFVMEESIKLTNIDCVIKNNDNYCI